MCSRDVAVEVAVLPILRWKAHQHLAAIRNEIVQVARLVVERAGMLRRHEASEIQDVVPPVRSDVAFDVAGHG
eukprot:8782540-Prorocentrum_lima.AAC.1